MQKICIYQQELYAMGRSKIYDFVCCKLSYTIYMNNESVYEFLRHVLQCTYYTIRRDGIIIV